jgi:hypothetical protein
VLRLLLGLLLRVLLLLLWQRLLLLRVLLLLLWQRLLLLRVLLLLPPMLFLCLLLLLLLLCLLRLPPSSTQLLLLCRLLPLCSAESWAYNRLHISDRLQQARYRVLHTRRVSRQLQLQEGKHAQGCPAKRDTQQQWAVQINKPTKLEWIRERGQASCLSFPRFSFDCWFPAEALRRRH